jgi:outer membrane murein-binding lipoprotein Lpp
MSDEVSNAPVEAPAAVVASSPTPDTASGASSSSDGPVSEATSPASEATPTVEGEVTTSAYDSYDWNNWDGKHDSWPEEYQRWGAKLHGTLAQERDELDSLQGLYNKLLGGVSDPRVEELTGQNQDLLAKVQAFEQQVATHNGALEAAKADYTKYQQAVYERDLKSATQWAESFQGRHAAVLADEKNRARMIQLIDLDMDAEDALEFLSLEEGLYEEAKSAYAEGTPLKHVRKLVAIQQREATPKPRPAARLTSGASRRAVPNQTNKIESRKPKTFDDIRNFAVEKAFARKRK